MEITLIGVLVCIISIYAFIKDEKLLLSLVVFFSIFTAASIINIEKTVTGITPIYFIGGLWILKVLIRHIKEGTLKENLIKQVFNNKLTRALSIFLVTIVLSEIHILIFSGKIEYNDLNSGVLNIIKFTSSNITQAIYIAFMVILCIFIVLEVKKIKDIKNLIRVFLFSCVFAIIWGICQFVFYYINIPYPAYLFNNNIALGQLYYQMIYGIKRVNSIALEPSTFALNILQFISIVLTLWISNYKICKSKKKSNMIFLLLVILALICGILTTSTTAYVGLALLILFLTIYIVFFSLKGGDLYKNKKRIGYIYLIMIIIFILVLLLIPKIFRMDPQTLINTLKDVTVNKLELESGNQRLNAIRMAFEIFNQSPFFGSGWGSFRSLDLFTNLISNLGLVGFASYIYILIILIKKCIRNRNKKESIALTGAMAIIIPTIALMISIPDLLFGYYWIGIAIVYNYLDNEEVEEIYENRD